MKYSELLEVAQHFEAEVTKDVIHVVALLEVKLDVIQAKIHRAEYLSALEKNALLDSVRFLQGEMRRPEDAKLPRGHLSCLKAMFEAHQEPLVFDVIQLYKQAQSASDKFRILDSLKRTISACTFPVRDECRGGEKLKRTGFYE